VKKLSVFFLSIVCFFSASAQTWTEGYIVKKSGDSLQGFIRERVDWYQPYIDFAPAQTSESTRIELIDVDHFYIKKYDVYYYSRILDIDKKPIATPKLETAPAQKIVKDTVALRLLVKGTVTLYDYTDENFKQHYFVQKNEGKIEQLAYVRYMSRGKLAEMPYFVNTLKAMLSDCDKVNESLIRYDEKSLIKVVGQYNSCFNATEFRRKKVPNKLSVGIFVGGGINQMGFKGDPESSFFQDPANTDFPSTTSFVAGVGLELISGRDAVRIVPGLELKYQKTGVSEVIVLHPSNQDDYTMNFTFVNSMVTIKYLFVKTPNLNVYARVGVGASYILDASSTFTRTDFVLQRATTRDFAIYKDVGFAYLGGVGSSYKRLFFDVTYGKNVFSSKQKAANGLCSVIDASLGFRILK